MRPEEILRRIQDTELLRALYKSLERSGYGGDKVLEQGREVSHKFEYSGHPNWVHLKLRWDRHHFHFAASTVAEAMLSADDLDRLIGILLEARSQMVDSEISGKHKSAPKGRKGTGILQR